MIPTPGHWLCMTPPGTTVANTTTVHVILSDRRERRIPFLERNLSSQNEIPLGLPRGGLRRFTPQNDMYGCNTKSVPEK